MSDTEDCPPPFPKAHPSEPEVTAEVAAPADPSPLEIRPVPASSAPTTPEVILYLRENFGMLSKTLEREVFRKGMITATVDEMLGRFTSQLGDLYQKVLLELGEEAMTVEMRAILLRTLQPSCNEGTAMVVDVLQSHILGVDGQFCALFNRDYLDDAVTMAHQVLDRNGPRDGNRPAVGDSPPTLNGANKSDAARHDGNPFCLDYENGRCTRGSSCRYRHEPLHDDMLLRGGQGATETTADFPSRPIVVLPHQMHHHHHHSQQPVHHHLHASQPQPMPTNSLSPASFSPTQVVVGRVPAGSALSSVKVLPQQPQFGSPSPSMSVPPPNSGFMQNAHPGYPSGRGGTPPAPGTPLPHSTHHIHHHHHSPTGHASPPPQHPMLAPLAHQHHMHNMHHHQHQHQHHILQPPQQQPQHNTLQGAVPHNFVAQPQALRHHHHHLHHHNNQQPLPSHPTHHIHHVHHHHHHHQSNHGPSGTNALQDAHPALLPPPTHFHHHHHHVMHQSLAQPHNTPAPLPQQHVQHHLVHHHHTVHHHHHQSLHQHHSPQSHFPSQQQQSPTGNHAMSNAPQHAAPQPSSPFIPLPRSTAANHAAPISIDAHDEDMPLNRAPGSGPPNAPGSLVHHHHHHHAHHHHAHHHHAHHHHSLIHSPQQPTNTRAVEDMEQFLASTNLRLLHEPLSKIIAMEELRSLTFAQFEQRIKKHVCSKSMREQLWDALHPDGNAPSTPRRDAAPAPGPAMMDQVAQLKDFAANNAIASFGMRVKQSAQGDETPDSASKATTKSNLSLPQPRSSVAVSPLFNRKPPNDEPSSPHSDQGKEVRALLWITGTARSTLKAIKEAASHYGQVLDCGYVTRGRDTNKDAVYIKYSTYNRELQQIKYISTASGRHTESFTVADLTLYNHGHLDIGGTPPIPDAIAQEGNRSLSDRPSTQQRPPRGSTGSPQHSPQGNASFGRRSAGDDSDRGRRHEPEVYDDDEDYDEDYDAPYDGRSGGRRRREGVASGRRGGSSGPRRGGRGGYEESRWDSHPAQTVCKYYRIGNGCRRGDLCKFAHPEE